MNGLDDHRSAIQAMGAKGGSSRAKTLSSNKRSEIAKQGATARWKKHYDTARKWYVVYRYDLDFPMAAFAQETWAEKWIGSLYLPREKYTIKIQYKL